MDNKENLRKEILLNKWLHEEEIAHIDGWDFSHIRGKYEEEHDLPWSYREIVEHYLRPELKLLDMDTGGGKYKKRETFVLPLLCVLYALTL